jgi:uncharacterized protein (TIGR03067 family)
MIVRTTVALLVLGAILVATVATTQKTESDPKKLTESMQGEWTVASMTKEEHPEVKDLAITVRIDGNKMTTLAKAQVGAVATYTIDTTTTPFAFDMKRTEGDDDYPPAKGIIRVEKDKLVICSAIGEGERPKEFRATKGTILMVLERAKK